MLHGIFHYNIRTHEKAPYGVYPLYRRAKAERIAESIRRAIAEGPGRKTDTAWTVRAFPVRIK